jgi:hypothetical protein
MLVAIQKDKQELLHIVMAYIIVEYMIILYTSRDGKRETPNEVGCTLCTRKATIIVCQFHRDINTLVYENRDVSI